MALKRSFIRALLVLSLALLCAAADGSWMKQVPAADRAQANPFQHDREKDAVSAGAKLYSYNCAQCHGDNAQGRGKRPGLRTYRIQHQATDGDLFWLLRNGNIYHGMPSWNAKLTSEARWQIVAYIKSLGPAPGATASGSGK